MLLDNSGAGKTVQEWIAANTDDGIFDVVTGYFTIGALACLSEKVNAKISRFRMTLGDIATVSEPDFRPLDLLNQEITADSALRLSDTAKNAVAFLKQDKVSAKTLEPNFCHAKLYLHESKDKRHNYFITGSSNLTEAGTGLKHTSNVELNIAETGENLRYKELREWFENLWESPKAHETKSVKTENGKNKEVNFKQYLIDEISKIFAQYLPNDIYLKILAEMFPEKTDEKFDEEIEILSKSEIYNKLYDFQKHAAVELIKMLNGFNGAVLADAVGLGKTWTALAVIKYYQRKGFDIIVLCPKKLESNWRKWKRKFNSIFERDCFEYFIRFHTDLEEERMINKAQNETADVFFTSEKPKLFVIDESHNLRNSKSLRYNFLLENILKKNESAKVLMLSATPINNSLLDIRNQFKFIPCEREIEKKLQINSIDSVFRTAQEKFNKWTNGENHGIKNLIAELPEEITELWDSLVIARTRKMIENIKFPRQNPPDNRWVTPNCVENCDTIDDLLNLLPEKFSAYMPAVYAEITSEKAVENESERDFFLVKMMHILLLKRLESSWFSFKETTEKILRRHENTLQKVQNYEDIEIEDLSEAGEIFEEEDVDVLGKRKIKISEIKNISAFKNDLREDVNKLRNLFEKLNKFDGKNDKKLNELVEIIKQKQKNGANGNNRKALIFTTYADTAFYLFEQLQKNGFDKIAVVSGDKSKISGDSKEYKDFESILQRFSPLAKVMKETGDKEKYERMLETPIDILIATDCLSEGQNLQDCDFVINYDIHWNPVRVVQRFGRIDRIGSENETISCVNFFPTDDINSYLKLQDRVEDKMALMKTGGAEIPRFTESFTKKSENEELERKQNDRNLRIMQNSIKEIEDGEKNFGFDNLSMELFRQDLTNDTREKYTSLPNGIFSGFIEEKNGLVALLKNKNDSELKLIFIDVQGKEILRSNGEILGFLRDNRYKDRFIPTKIDKCDAEEIKMLHDALKQWFINAAPTAAITQIHDFFAESVPLNVFDSTKVEEKYQPKEWNLLCWCIVSGEAKNET